jgi:hypothetical protein
MAPAPAYAMLNGFSRRILNISANLEQGLRRANRIDRIQTNHPMSRFKSQSTPNPNSLKITRKKGRFIDSGLLTFASAAEAENHPLASALFRLDGVVNILILPDFLTVSKTPDRSWKPLWREIEKTLEGFFDPAG